MQRKEYHIITTGISLIINFIKNPKNARTVKKYKMMEWLKIEPEEKIEKTIKNHTRKTSKLYKKLLTFLEENPYKASAETNSLLRYCDFLGVKYENITAKIYTTDTAIGYFAGRIIHDYLTKQKFELDGKPEKIKYFGWGASFFDNALVEVLDKITKTLAKAQKQGYITVLNATGGFKPETTFAVIAALLSDVDKIYYIHETFKEIVVLPGLPLTIKKEYLKTLRKFKKPVEKWYAIEHMLIPEIEIIKLKEKGLLKEKIEKLETREWIKKLL
ncbi:MAG: hypothetical protein B6U95_06545 [Thermofilum sp. ex4484_82]|uniref:CRISPR-associated protein n=1 Tax=Desulfofervidus auxilii TaxID=1621989 RepID=A0A7V0NEF5_DESA2|nr:MAG: hypothetical protein B6U95_06545 [Thermofilum sp. ex4484_82]OYT37480.1 MAG: hypothetical protein B6U96_06535 [Archaeoglobales archaeon ex4484_92]HDD35616.1 putative CRISPR-associated protein [Candidatus Desulfofervidus auxilii]